MRLENKVALVVGGGRNIGRAISLRFASEGAKIAIFDMDKDRAESVAAEVAEAGGDAATFQGEVNNVADVKNAIAGVVERFGKIDVLTNCAAISDRQPMLQLDDAEYHKIIDVTQNGTYYTCKYVAEQMVKQGTGGSIVNFSSGSAIQGNAHRVAYDMAKGAIVTLTMDMAVQLAQYGIRTNCIAPGITGSQVGGMIKFEDRTASNLMGRPAYPDEQAATALFLASDEASHIIGQTISVDGGTSVM